MQARTFAPLLLVTLTLWTTPVGHAQGVPSFYEPGISADGPR
jgi:hypothetical protein